MNAPIDAAGLIPALTPAEIPARLCVNCYHSVEGDCAKSSFVDPVHGEHRLFSCRSERGDISKDACGPNGRHYVERREIVRPRLVFIENAIVAAKPDFIEASEIISAVRASLKNRPEAESQDLAEAFDDLRGLLEEMA